MRVEPRDDLDHVERTRHWTRRSPGTKSACADSTAARHPFTASGGSRFIAARNAAGAAAIASEG
jgi:hypothetical protein